MSINSSSASSFTLFLCSDSGASFTISLAVTVVKTIVILPLCVLVLHLGHRRWRQQRSFQTTSHSDVFTYHVATVELVWFLGCFCHFCGIFTNRPEMTAVGFWINNIVFHVEILFHLLTCVERYLAVVHPITYLGLRNERGVRIRNISCGCVWLLSVGSVGLAYVPRAPILFFCFLSVSLMIVSFCSVAVLCALIRPGPGDGGGAKERVDQSKRRAFHTMTAVLGALLLWFLSSLVSIAMMRALELSHSVVCVVAASFSWLNLPSSAVLPLLYLHRAGPLPRFWSHSE